MAVPKRRTSKMKGRKRRTHYTALTATVTACRSCGSPVRPHNACPACGQYRGREIIKVAAEE
ncbi:MAG: 50S ribosomal protein L32 [Deltaproteobacteria bacterium]|jgi:large subunit ribosomal protein L32|nr:50S ribosomal protein L32 [Deltaproteobacteria bacterium]